MPVLLHTAVTHSAQAQQTDVTSIALGRVRNTTIVIISAVAAVLFSLYLIYDLQMIMGGKTYSLSPDDYVAASLSIYLDVVNIFLALLTIIGITQN